MRDWGNGKSHRVGFDQSASFPVYMDRQPRRGAFAGLKRTCTRPAREFLFVMICEARLARRGSELQWYVSRIVSDQRRTTTGPIGPADYNALCGFAPSFRFRDAFPGGPATSNALSQQQQPGPSQRCSQPKVARQPLRHTALANVLIHKFIHHSAPWRGHTV